VDQTIFHGLTCSQHRLCQHLPTENTWRAYVTAAAPKQIDFELLQFNQPEQL
jgi:hypothetical protein